MIRIARQEEIPIVSQCSVSVGNIPLLSGQSIAAVMETHGHISGFAAVQVALHAAGSWVDESERRRGLSYELRECLDGELKRRGFSVYFALPQSDFEKQLFAKYGHVTEHLAQIRHL